MSPFRLERISRRGLSQVIGNGMGNNEKGKMALWICICKKFVPFLDLVE